MIEWSFGGGFGRLSAIAVILWYFFVREGSLSTVYEKAPVATRLINVLKLMCVKCVPDSDNG